jgi:hypothetical protein
LSQIHPTEPEGLHFRDGSHNWIAPAGVPVEEWEEVARAHVEAHKADLDAGSMPRRPPPPILG